jgi:hypothetical protein
LGEKKQRRSDQKQGERDSFERKKEETLTDNLPVFLRMNRLGNSRHLQCRCISHVHMGPFPLGPHPSTGRDHGLLLYCDNHPVMFRLPAYHLFPSLLFCSV